jgi:hypothetical protein
MGQKYLFKVKKVDKKPLSKLDKSIVKILEAKRTDNWDNINDTDFTNYYIQTHNIILDKRIVFDFYISVTSIREGLRLRYEIPKEKMCYYINRLLRLYKEIENNFDYLSFNMIKNNIPLMDKLINVVKEETFDGDYETDVEDNVKEKYKDKKVF